MIKSLFIFLLSFTFISCKVDTQDEKFDQKTKQQPVLTHQGIDSVLAKFEQITYSDLDTSYLNYTLSNGKFKNSLKKEKFYVIQGDEVSLYIVGNYRIKNFMSRDKYFKTNRLDLESDHKQYWLVDKNMLYMMLDLILKLEAEGYYKYGFEVRESHRHPKYNIKSGGASSSQHIWGKAVDIVIEDINNDGKETQADKTIVLKMLEEIVGNKGGLGKYPGSMTVHFDVRGYKARWDKQ